MKKPITSEEMETIKQLAAEGVTAREIAERLGRRYNTICSLMVKMGLRNPEPETWQANFIREWNNMRAIFGKPSFEEGEQ